MKGRVYYLDSFLTLIPTISSTAITNAVLLFNLMKFYYWMFHPVGLQMALKCSMISALAKLWAWLNIYL